jgi:hypothetical protein
MSVQFFICSLRVETNMACMRRQNFLDGGPWTVALVFEMSLKELIGAFHARAWHDCVLSVYPSL